MGSNKKLSLFLALMMIISSLSLGVFAQDTYTIKSGDVLWKIAKNHGMDYKTLAAYNRISNPNKIFAGKMLKFPPVAVTVKPVIPVVTAPPVPAEPVVKTITILHTNDMHGLSVMEILTEWAQQKWRLISTKHEQLIPIPF